MKNNALGLSVLFLLCAAGAICGYFLQNLRSNYGFGVYTPALIVPIIFIALGIMLLVLAVRLRKKMRTQRSLENPFMAVRLLAAARSGQVLGALGSGFGLGLLLWIGPRLAEISASLWLPMVLVIGAGLLLAVLAIISEILCRVPPDSGDGETKEKFYKHYGAEAAETEAPGYTRDVKK